MPGGPGHADVEQLVELLAGLGEQQAQAAVEQAPPPAAAGGGIDMEKLKQLGDLHAAGILSDEEFAAAKAKVLAG